VYGPRAGGVVEGRGVAGPRAIDGRHGGDDSNDE
jgi:hypothetical protein